MKRIRAEKEAADSAADLAELLEQKQRQFERDEKERKTKSYYDIDKFNRRIAPKDQLTYYGEYQNTKGAWVPHGPGQYLVNDEEVQREGTFINGELWGQGRYVHADGSIWWVRRIDVVHLQCDSWC